MVDLVSNYICNGSYSIIVVYNKDDCTACVRHNVKGNDLKHVVLHTPFPKSGVHPRGQIV